MSFAAAGTLQQAGSTRFLKDLVRPGHFEHPTDGWKRDISAEDELNWLRSFQEMSANGVKVPIYTDHDDAEAKDQSERTRGYLEDMWLGDTDTLYGVVGFTAEDGPKLAQTVGQVSIFVDPNFVDGEGREYGEAITHVTLTPEPIVPGQGEFIPMSRVSAAGPAEESEEMDELLKELQTRLGIEDEVTADNALELIGTAFDAAKTEQQTKLDELTQQIAASRTKKDEPLDPDTEDMLVEGAEAKLDKLVADGKITPAVSAKLAASLIGESGSRQGYLLSRHRSGTPKSVCRSILDALEDNNVVELGEQTRGQGLSLSHPSDADQKASDEAADEMIEMAGGTAS
jgi:hypothetical protein